MIASALYRLSGFVLKDPVLVKNSYILQHTTPLGYMPVRRFLEVDLNSLKATPVGFETEQSRSETERKAEQSRSWHLVPLQYRYYDSTWHPALSIRMQFDDNGNFTGRDSNQWKLHMEAMHSLRDWATQHAPDITPDIQGMLDKLNEIDDNAISEIAKRLMQSGYGAIASGHDKRANDERANNKGANEEEKIRKLLRSLPSLWVFTWNGKSLFEDPRVLEWQRMHFVLNGYAKRLNKHLGDCVRYSNGKVYIDTGMPIQFTSMLTGKVITDLCIYMVPNLSGESYMEQLLSYYSPQFSSYGLDSNLNAPMGLDESWWVAATASIVFQDRQYSVPLARSFSLSFLPLAQTHGNSPVNDDIRDILSSIIVIEEDTEETSEEGKESPEDRDGSSAPKLDPEVKAAHRAAVKTASQFRKPSDRRPTADKDMPLIVALRQKSQGRSPLRYYAELPLGSRSDTSHNTARGRFHHLKNALRLTNIDGQTIDVGLRSVIGLMKELYLDNIPAASYAELWRCSFENRPYPAYLVVETAIAAAKWLSHGKGARKQPLRIRLSGSKVLSAIAFLKAHLYFSGYEVSEELNYKSDNTWYNLGRVIAICQWFQRQSLGDKQTNVENVLPSVQTSPSRVIGHVLLSVIPHISKLERNQPGEFSKLMSDLGFSVNSAVPEDILSVKRLDHNQLALVMLGYFQQLTQLFRKETNGKKSNNSKQEENNG